MNSRTTPPSADQPSTHAGDEPAGARPLVERRAPRASLADAAPDMPDQEGGAATPKPPFRRRASDDPDAPLPARAAVQPTGFGAHAVGHAIRYLRRATDELPPGTPPSSIDVATPGLRQRLLDVDAAGAAGPRLRTFTAWLRPVLVVVGIVALLVLGWLVSGW